MIHVYPYSNSATAPRSSSHRPPLQASSPSSFQLCCPANASTGYLLLLGSRLSWKGRVSYCTPSCHNNYNDIGNNYAIHTLYTTVWCGDAVTWWSGVPWGTAVVQAAVSSQSQAGQCVTLCAVDPSKLTTALVIVLYAAWRVLSWDGFFSGLSWQCGGSIWDVSGVGWMNSWGSVVLTLLSCSVINQDPFRSNPLCRGYCGLLAFMMSRKEKDRKQAEEEEEDMLGSSLVSRINIVQINCSDIIAQGQRDSLYGRQAEQQWREMIQLMPGKVGVMDSFIHKYWQLLMELGREKESLDLLQFYRDLYPNHINAHR